MKPLRMAYLVALVAGVGFFITSVAWLGVWPARVLEEQARAFGPTAARVQTPSELRGREIYAREGCGYCHTQQVRFTAADEARFGAPTLAWESRRDVPHMLGTRRIGPDLSRTSGTRPEDWHLVHLYNPRLVVSQSVMPGYPWLFDDGPDRPKQAALDVVAYLESLGRPRLLAAVGTDDVIVVNPASRRRTGALPTLPESTGARGAELYTQHCASCHGPDMKGDGPGTRGLLPAPTSLADRRYRSERLLEALWHGVPGTAMPAWRDLPLADLAALVSHVQEPTADVRPDQIGEAPAPGAADLGARVFAGNCAQCHGPSGAGDGPSAGALPRPPTNFRLQRMSFTGVVTTLEEGIPGSMMTPWGSRLSRAEMAAVAHHVRGLFGGEPVRPNR